MTADDAAFEKEPDLIPATEAAKPDSGFSWGLAIFLVAAVLFVVFVVQNMSDVLVKLFGWEFTLPLPLLLVITALIAVVADEIFGLMRRRRRRRRLAEKEELARYRRT
ncbi:MAG TPA: LapA family protein [Acidimicrobiia bacterium]